MKNIGVENYVYIGISNMENEYVFVSKFIVNMKFMQIGFFSIQNVCEFSWLTNA